MCGSAVDLDADERIPVGFEPARRLRTPERTVRSGISANRVWGSSRRPDARGHIPAADSCPEPDEPSSPLPVLIHPEFWSKRRIALPGREPFEMPVTSRGALQDVGFEIIERPEPSFLFGASVLITGEVARTTDFEKGMPVHQALRNGSWKPDPLILDDQALVVHLRDRGLVVLTGCGHAGIVNTVRYARALTGVEHVHAVLGGFHLTGKVFEPIIGPTVDGLAALAPEVVSTGALHRLAGHAPAREPTTQRVHPKQHRHQA